VPEVEALKAALEDDALLVGTGLVLQELLQGFSGPRARDAIVERFAALPFVAPDRQDHVDAASLRNRCRRADVQIGTIDALLAQLCIRHDLTLLTTDRDFHHAARHCPLRVWRASAAP
jgi:predicted nucleic acid-binding protein